MNTLKKAYKQLSKNQVNNSKQWYIKASNFANYLSKKYSVSYDKTCAVIAALSPACNWNQNKRDAELLIICFVTGANISDFAFSTYGPNVVKALNILNSNKNPESFFSVKTGAKTLNFYHNILNPNDSDYVTIDRHAAAVYEGRKTSGSVRLTPKQYANIASAYIATAKELNMLPNQLQAVLWDGHISTRKNVNGK